jgi:hypothetical protein
MHCPKCQFDNKEIAKFCEEGRTTGRGKDALTEQPTRPIKEAWGYPLAKRFRELLSEGSP